MDRTSPSEDEGEVGRLLSQVEQLQAALKASVDEAAKLAEQREGLLQQITAHERGLLAIEPRTETQHQPDRRQEDLRLALVETQALTDELEIANKKMLQTNRQLDERVEERTRELENKNAALAESEQRFRTLVEGMPQLVWRAVDKGSWTWASPQWSEYTGQAKDESRGAGWLKQLHPQDRAKAVAAWDKALENSGIDIEYRIHRAIDDSYRWFRTRATPVLDPKGFVIEWLGTSTDLDDLRNLQRRQELLVAELQHRVRNMLTVVRSVFSKTVDAGGELEEVADHFKGRLDALARTQVIVTRSAAGTVDLQDLIRDELLSVGANDGPTLRLSGPDVALPSKTAESIGLAIHELTTNAVKYGALKVPAATLDISWNTNIDGRSGRKLTIVWTEQGVPAVPTNPSREGFGRELIEEALPYRLGAETKLQFRGGGVRCSITVPLSNDSEGADEPKD